MENQNKNEQVLLAEKNALILMILGIIAIAMSTVIGIVCGAIAMNKSKTAKGVLPNNSLATVGYVTGLIGFIMGILTTISSIYTIIMMFIDPTFFNFIFSI